MKLFFQMNLNEIKIKLEQQFVDDYDDLYEFMININETLKELNINSRYDSYNDFCLDIEKHILDDNIDIISPKVMSDALNNMIKFKIIEDDKYEEKILEKFNNDPDIIINDIENIKNKFKK